MAYNNNFEQDQNGQTAQPSQSAQYQGMQSTPVQQPHMATPQEPPQPFPSIQALPEQPAQTQTPQPFSYTPPMQAIPKKNKRSGKKAWLAILAVVAIGVSGLLGGAWGAQNTRQAMQKQMNIMQATLEVLEQNNTNTAANDTVITPSETPSNYFTTGNSSDVLAIPDIVNKTKESVVSITVQNAARMSPFGMISGGMGSGSGVIISTDGYILTNNHVVTDSTKYMVVLDNGDEYEASLVGTDSITDLAIIKIDAKGLKAATLGDSDNLRVGDMAMAIGDPLGELAGTVTVGVISALNREITLDNKTMNLLQTDASINSGNSGGALVNSSGEVIGIVVAKTSGSGIEGLGFAIPVNDAKKVIDELIENGRVTGRPSMGLGIVEISSQQVAQQYGVSELGLYIGQVMPGGAADMAGAQVGDRIVSLEGQTAETVAALNVIKNTHKVNDTVSLVINREGKDITLTLVLQESAS